MTGERPPALEPPAIELAGARDLLAELAPLLRRAVSLDRASLARIRMGDGKASVLVRLPFAVLVGRAVPAEHSVAAVDVTVRSADVLAWLDGDSPQLPDRHDADWRAGVPPTRGWRRVDTVPDHVVRGLVRTGANALTEAAEREGVPGAQPRAEVADALLDSVVLTVSEENGPTAEITLRTLSALTRMGFMPRDSHIGVDVAGRWVRVAAEYGSVYAERADSGLNLL
jgi:hypothetical protein